MTYNQVMLQSYFQTSYKLLKLLKQSSYYFKKVFSFNLVNYFLLVACNVKRTKSVKKRAKKVKKRAVLSAQDLH